MLNNYTLSDSDFNKLREIVYKEAGIKLSDVKKVLVQSRLLKRLRELKIVSFSDYYDYLIANYETEKINFINLITTNKTDFFREKDHFEFMKDVILPDIERKNLSELRIWSAGCSSGEEPYTIAMVIKEYFKNKKSPEILILATDIDTQVLEKAKSGLYSEEHISPVEEKYIKSYFFKEVINGEIYYRIRESLKECVYFRRLNLLQEQYPMKRQFDIIFCRNVIIYFDRDSQRKLFDKFYNYLKDDGYLLIGHSENITNVTDKFILHGRTIYRKAL
ncbi:MAG TPA: protein-glutamate O-methyltransferase [Spirochaetota bacterium]|jgi:chemotaxis protein methyltransferase CheR|nr:protein-glutamate O-methyltransferase [Spirochaetota bacterium]HOK91667.1 protein-glutamate O-methyltransferase [Spirochaetota bacterium]HPD78634.1 protein-glutamate O-methyltransferase [Spirochaetota bacterium]HPP95967.1 protein-glutamate O-methyltransferase [Spirochaetota bacterium]HRS63203.1 protein-glutamate O-methyltransferase [Spirochaetota bacterium]